MRVGSRLLRMAQSDQNGGTFRSKRVLPDALVVCVGVPDESTESFEL